MDKALSMQDLFKKSIVKLDVFTNSSWVEILVTLVITLIIGLFIFFIYRKTFSGVVYSHNYNVSIVLMTVLTSLIILTISSNVVLSLGMVGALSIVRFRTALKEPMDIVFMFWAIAVGIASGAGFYPIAIIGSIFVGATLLILTKARFKKASYLLVIHHTEAASIEVDAKLRDLKHILKSKTVKKGMVELTVEVKIKDGDTDFVNDFSNVNGVEDAVLISYNGDYAA